MKRIGVQEGFTRLIYRKPLGDLMAMLYNPLSIFWGNFFSIVGDTAPFKEAAAYYLRCFSFSRQNNRFPQSFEHFAVTFKICNIIACHLYQHRGNRNTEDNPINPSGLFTQVLNEVVKLASHPRFPIPWYKINQFINKDKAGFFFWKKLPNDVSRGSSHLKVMFGH